MLNFFGVRHGKGPCDACAGRVKQQVVSLVKTETAYLNSARNSMILVKSTWKPKKQMVVYISPNSLNLQANWQVGLILLGGLLYGTHKLHSITTVPKKMVLNIRNFLCCCKGCLHGDDPCVNDVCPEDWWAYDLQKKKFVPPSLSS